MASDQVVGGYCAGAEEVNLDSFLDDTLKKIESAADAFFGVLKVEEVIKEIRGMRSDVDQSNAALVIKNALMDVSIMIDGAGLRIKDCVGSAGGQGNN